jgi:large subunit ribosomal protein L13e
MPIGVPAHSPVELLRPAVRAPTVRYNRKLRAGRGFTKAELKQAGLRAKEALSLGVPVDHRRRNRSEEGLKLNVERLEAYKARLVVFPKKAGKVKKGDTEGASKDTERLSRLAAAFPIPNGAGELEQPREITSEEKNAPSAYDQLRKARSDARLVGVRAERERKKREEEEAKKKVRRRSTLRLDVAMLTLTWTPAVNPAFSSFLYSFPLRAPATTPPFFSKRFCTDSSSDRGLSMGVATASWGSGGSEACVGFEGSQAEDRNGWIRRTPLRFPRCDGTDTRHAGWPP